VPEVGGEGEGEDQRVGELLRSVLGPAAAEAVDVDELEFHVGPRLFRALLA